MIPTGRPKGSTDDRPDAITPPEVALTVHLTVSVGRIGAVIVYLAVVVAAWTSQDVQTVRASWIGMELIG